MAFQVHTPDKFEFSKPQSWLQWIKIFERFRIASGLDEKAASVQVNTLLYTMGSKVEDIYTSFNLEDDDQNNYDTVKERFKDHFIIRRNIIFERAQFNLRNQNSDESVDEYITSLYSMAEHLKFGNLHDELLRDKIVVGIKDKRLSERLQLDTDLTLQGAINKVRQSESVKQQQSILHQELNIDSSSNSVGRIKRSRKPKSKLYSGSTCSRCGKHSTVWINHNTVWINVLQNL